MLTLTHTHLQVCWKELKTGKLHRWRLNLLGWVTLTQSVSFLARRTTKTLCECPNHLGYECGLYTTHVEQNPRFGNCVSRSPQGSCTASNLWITMSFSNGTMLGCFWM